MKPEIPEKIYTDPTQGVNAYIELRLTRLAADHGFTPAQVDELRGAMQSTAGFAVQAAWDEAYSRKKR